MIACGHPEGLHVTLMDRDVISPTNCVRQPFSRFEVKLYKPVVLINRLNLFWNLGWEAVPEHLTRKEPLDRVDVVIGCVDARAARAVIRECTSSPRPARACFAGTALPLWVRQLSRRVRKPTGRLWREASS
jgi:hypothetical protein